MIARCKSCGAPIVWAKTPEGKSQPLSVASKARRIVVGDDGLARVVETYLSHFSDCPNANEHRSRR